jgi:Raf kinase inhibitor-like YbhB/YbcL family protein
MVLKVQLPDIKEGEMIDRRYSCEGEDISPALVWSEAPSATESFAIVMDDPDAPGGTFIHWVLYNIGSESSSIQENLPRLKSTSLGYSQGINSFGRIGYNGPCPPRGTTHRYYFRIFALSTKEKFRHSMSRDDLMRMIEGKVIESAVTMRKFGR